MVHLILKSTLISLLFNSALSQQSTGENCIIEAQVDCRLLDGTNRVCEALKNTPYDQCGDVFVEWTYSYCNLNDVRMYFHKALTVPLLHNEDVSSLAVPVFDKSEMAPNECRYRKVPYIVNSCHIRNTVASLKLEGNLSNRPNGEGNYCYSWAFSKQKIGMPPGNTGIVGPVIEAPTSSPVKPVAPEDPSVTLTINCHYESELGSNNYNRDCNFIQDIVPQTKGACNIPVLYTYTIMNNSRSRTVTLYALTNENTSNILSDFPDIGPLLRYQDTVTDILDICTLQGTTVTKKGLVLAGSVPPGAQASDEAELVIQMPSLISEWDLVDIKCFLNDGTRCGDVDHCFAKEVNFEYDIMNVGVLCTEVTALDIMFGHYASKPLSLPSNCNSCPGDVWTLTEKRYINTCDKKDYDVDIIVHTDDKTSLVSGEWKGPDAIVPGPSPTVSSKAPTPTPPATICTTNVKTVTFKYNGGHNCWYGQGRRRALRRDRSLKSKGKGSKKYNPVAPSPGNFPVAPIDNAPGSSPTCDPKDAGCGTTTTTTTVTTTTVTTQYCNCADFHVISPTDSVNIDVQSKNGKRDYGFYSDIESGEIFIANGHGDNLKNNITVKIYNVHGVLVQSIDILTGNVCMEELQSKHFGAVSIVDWS